MAVKSFKGGIGRQRITKNVSKSEASFTRNSRKQFDKVERQLSTLLKSIEDITPDALDEAIRPTFDKAVSYTPKDTGKLRESGFLDVNREGKRVKASVGFGKGGDPFYAVFVHERTDLQHTAPTRAKFLQTAFEEDAGILIDRLRAAYKKRLRR